MEPQTTECSASVWPHRHTDEMGGPLDIKISFRNQPPVVRKWTKKQPVWILLRQPDERTNLTLLQIRMHLADEVRAWYRVSHCRLLPDRTLKFYIKARIVKTVPHPIPRGVWKGYCEYTDTAFMFTFQAMTMKAQPKDEPRIILPDGTLPAKKKIKLVIP